MMQLGLTWQDDVSNNVSRRVIAREGVGQRMKHVAKLTENVIGA